MYKNNITPEVVAKRKNTLQQNVILPRLISDLKKRYPSLTLVGTFYGMQEYAQFKCTKCNSITKCRPALIFKNKAGCRRCRKNKVKADAEKRKKAYREELLKKFENYLEPFNTRVFKNSFVNNESHAKLFCKTCRRAWLATPKSTFKMKNICNKCAINAVNERSFKDFTKQKESLLKWGFLPIGKPETRETILKMKCLSCNHVNRLSYLDVIKTHRRCEVCFPSLNGKINKFHFVKINGKLCRVQGYERFAVKYLKSKEVIHGASSEMPKITYKYNKRIHRYTPDFLVDRSQVVEVKSLYTAGLLSGGKHKIKYQNLKAKRIGSIKSGFDFKLIIFDAHGNKLKIPKDWYTYTKPELLSFIKKHNSIKIC